MPITEIHDRKIVDAVRKNLEQSEYHEYVKQILDKLCDYPVYLWGGAVRDPILKSIYGWDGKTADFDINVDDSGKSIDLTRMVAGFTDVFFNRFGYPKWRPINGLQIDIGKFSTTNRLRSGENLPICMESVLSGCDFTTGAIAYRISEPLILSNGAMEAIQKRTIDVCYLKADEPHVLMSKAVWHAEKFGFELGDSCTRFIADSYKPETDGHIRRYLAYKQMGDKYGFIVGKLRDIKARATGEKVPKHADYGITA